MRDSPLKKLKQAQSFTQCPFLFGQMFFRSFLFAFSLSASSLSVVFVHLKLTWMFHEMKQLRRQRHKPGQRMQPSSKEDLFQQQPMA